MALGDLLLGLDGDSSGDQTVLVWVDLPGDPTWVQDHRIIVGVMEMAVETMEDQGTVVLDQTVDLLDGSPQTGEAY